MWRQGDVMIAAVEALPAGAKKRPNTVLARGEITGHSHRVQEPDVADLWEHDGVFYLRVLADTATVIHQEHAAITLPSGVYRVWQQREYTPRQIRRVVD